MAMNRLPPTSSFVQRAATAPQTPSVAAAPAAPALQREEPAHGHEHAGHAQHGHATPHATGRGPTPRPRRSSKANKPKRRKKTAAATPSDDDDLEMPEAHEHGTGVAAVAFDGTQRDSGDDDAEGGDERSRQDRLARVRHLADEATGSAAGAASLGRLPRLHGGAQARLAVERFAQRACDVVAQGAPDMGRQLKQLQLRLLRETPGVRRLDRGGIARVKQLLANHMPRSRARAGRPAGAESVARIANGNLMLVMQLLQLQVPMTPAQREQSIARLAVQTHGT